MHLIISAFAKNIITHVRVNSKFLTISRCVYGSGTFFSSDSSSDSSSSSSDSSDSDNERIPYKPPVPGKKAIIRKQQMKNEVKKPLNDARRGFDANLLKSVNELASALKVDQKSLSSDLLSRLKMHSISKSNSEPEPPPMQDIPVEEEIRKAPRFASNSEKNLPEPEWLKTSSEKLSDLSTLFNEMKVDSKSDKEGARISPTASMFKESESHRLLFSARPLNIFKEDICQDDRKSLMDLLSERAPAISSIKKNQSWVETRSVTWDTLELEELEKSHLSLPRNAFEEQIMWTRQGKMWKFPINNEANMEEEESIPFHKHIFLDNLILDFPKPLHDFMSLVVHGLSKNPHLSLKEKEAHIEWYREYFKDKMEHFSEDSTK